MFTKTENSQCRKDGRKYLIYRTENTLIFTPKIVLKYKYETKIRNKNKKSF